MGASYGSHISGLCAAQMGKYITAIFDWARL
jgi:hypothetical protein